MIYIDHTLCLPAAVLILNDERGQTAALKSIKFQHLSFVLEKVGVGAITNSCCINSALCVFIAHAVSCNITHMSEKLHKHSLWPETQQVDRIVLFTTNPLPTWHCFPQPITQSSPPPLSELSYSPHL